MRAFCRPFRTRSGLSTAVVALAALFAPPMLDIADAQGQGMRQHGDPIRSGVRVSRSFERPASPFTVGGGASDGEGRRIGRGVRHNHEVHRQPSRLVKRVKPVVVRADAAERTTRSAVSGGGDSGGTSRNQTRRRGGGGAVAPLSASARYVPGEVVIELAAGTTNEAAQILAARHRLTRLESFDFELGGTKIYRWRINDRRTVPAVIRRLQADRSVLSAQPNYYAYLQQTLASAPSGRSAAAFEQYALAKLKVREAHALATGSSVLVAVIDGGVDLTHPELAGTIADSFDAIGTGEPVHPHGTAVAGAIAAQARLKGTAPAARILAARAFGSDRAKDEGTTYFIVKAINWAVAHNARIINMSFAGPRDPKIEVSLKAAREKGIVLIAAAGNAGPKSPPLYPAADPNVIAVTATDSADRLFQAANRGNHIAVSAPGVELWLPALEGTYQTTSGTSFAAAEVSGTAALLLERRPELEPDGVRQALTTTARDLGPKGDDPQFGAGLVDAYKAILSVQPAASTGESSGAPSSVGRGNKVLPSGL